MEHFLRYTNLAATIHLLKNKKITLLNPATWDDKNDAHFMAEYKRLSKVQSLLALCFAEAEQTYHHWRVFSYGPDGVCIEFDKSKILEAFSKNSNIRCGYVNYKRINETKSIKIDDLPFIKRYPYKDEREYRVVFADQKKSFQYMEFDIRISWINRITLSPWIPRQLFDSTKVTLRLIPECSQIKIYRSVLIESDRWQTVTNKFRVKPT